MYYRDVVVLANFSFNKYTLSNISIYQKGKRNRHSFAMKKGRAKKYSCFLNWLVGLECFKRHVILVSPSLFETQSLNYTSYPCMKKY